MTAQAKALALILLAGCADEVQSSPTEAVLTHLTPKMAGQNWRLGQVITIRETERESVVGAVITIDGRNESRYFALSKQGRWEVRQDLIELFRTQVFEAPGAQKDAATRCADRVAERWNIATTVVMGGDGFDVKGGEATVWFRNAAFTVEPSEPGLMAMVSINMIYPSEPGSPRGQFQDVYLYKDGRWERQGVGRLFDLAPPR